ncbi:MAG: hypothetical protein ACRDMX_13755 [Solirubrobacteraceae bacterium]
MKAVWLGVICALVGFGVAFGVTRAVDHPATATAAAQTMSAPHLPPLPVVVKVKARVVSELHSSLPSLVKRPRRHRRHHATVTSVAPVSPAPPTTPPPTYTPPVEQAPVIPPSTGSGHRHRGGGSGTTTIG